MPEKPSFPVIMFLVAASKDFLLDPLILGLTLLILPAGWLLGIFIAFIYGGIFTLWLFFKPASVKIQRLVMRSAVRLAIALLISAIPLVRFVVPEMTLLVYFTYRAEVNVWKRKYARAQKTLREELEKAGKARQQKMLARMRRTTANDNEELYAQAA